MLNLGALLFVLPYFCFPRWLGSWPRASTKHGSRAPSEVFEMAIMALAGWGFSLRPRAGAAVVPVHSGRAFHDFRAGEMYPSCPKIFETKHLLTGNGLIESGTFLPAILFGQILGAAMAGQGSTVLTVVVFVVAAAGLPAACLCRPHRRRIRRRKSTGICGVTRKSCGGRYARKTNCAPPFWGISWFWLVGAAGITLHAAAHVHAAAFGRQCQCVQI